MDSCKPTLNRFLLTLVGFAIFSSSLLGQEERELPNPVWKIDLPAGTFLVNLSAITSISTHQYVVDGVMLVDECTIGTTGGLIARFYSVGSINPEMPLGVGETVLGSLREKAQEVRERLDTAGLSNAVVKNYPTTTHAQTVEYRLANVAEVQRVYTSVERALLSGRGLHVTREEQE
ncbi:MAG: hypothetical protein ACFCU3_05820 [Verrucomicrobiales bacterium]